MEHSLDKHILLVEDDAIIGMATRSRLEKLGYRITLATSGARAIECAANTGDIDLVLMDIDLGHGPNGIETCKAIIEKKYIPVVFVSSHTEKEIVSLTEQITSYGYIVKSSHLTVYDASIKMAFKLYREKQRREIFNRYLEVALDNSSEPVFITDREGDIVFFNKAFMFLQGLSESQAHLLERKFANHAKIIKVFDVEGISLPLEQWASSRALQGLSSTDSIYIVYHTVVCNLMINTYSYSPIFSEDNELIGAYVKIMPMDVEPYRALLNRIVEEHKLSIAGA